MPEFPFALQWTIPENQLIPLRDSITRYLYSTSVSNIPGFEYFLSVCPNGNNENNRGIVRFSLHLKPGNVKKVQADTDSGKNDDEKQKWEGAELGDELWGKNDTKDFTIVADGKELKVHKLILGSRSEVFSAMFKPNTKESIESKVEITDFSSNVVEAAFKMIYSCNFVTTLSDDEIMSLLQFFNKYNLPTIKDIVEIFLIDKVSATNVCRFTNYSILTNSSKLKMKCTEFLMVSFASKTAVSAIQILDKDFGMEVLQKMVYQIVETE